MVIPALRPIGCSTGWGPWWSEPTRAVIRPWCCTTMNRRSSEGDHRCGVGSVVQCGLHGLHRWWDCGLGADLIAESVECLQTVTGDQQDGLGVGVEPAGLDELLRRRHGDASGRLGEDPLR